MKLKMNDRVIFIDERTKLMSEATILEVNSTSTMIKIGDIKGRTKWISQGDLVKQKCEVIESKGGANV